MKFSSFLCEEGAAEAPPKFAKLPKTNIEKKGLADLYLYAKFQILPCSFHRDNHHCIIDKVILKISC
jgi:hypothetical protein